MTNTIRESGIREFWSFLGRLKREPRRGWGQKLGLRRPESVGDHSYAVAMLCLYEGARRGGYDLELLLKLALIHDLDEAITGDLTPEDKRALGKAEVERGRDLARSQILRAVPIGARDEWIRLWSDLSVRMSREAKFVKDLDLMEMALQARDYEKCGVSRKKVSEFYESALRGVEDSELKRELRRMVDGEGKKLRR